MIENWIDVLTKAWEISDGKTGTVKSYRVYEKDEFPEEVPLNMATALTFVDEVDLDYSQGGPCIAVWHGSTYFHLTGNLARSNVPYVLLFFGRILTAAAKNMKLGGAVDYFALEPTGSISMVELRYGTEATHMGLEVKWIVKEQISGLVVA